MNINPTQIYKNCAFLGMILACSCAPLQIRNVDQQESILKNPADEKTSPLKSLGHSKLPFQWDKIIRVENEVDGLIINHISFTQQKSLFFLKSSQVKIKADVQVTNASNIEKHPYFSIAVFNEEGVLLGVAGGGTWIRGVKSKETTTFTLAFEPMKERVPMGTLFHLSVELN